MLAARVRARHAGSGLAGSQPMASDTSTPSLLLTCKRVLQCESMWVAGEARTRAACVTSVLCTRVVVYRAQRGERGRGGGEDEAVAKPGAHIEIGKSGNREIGKRTARIRVTQCDHAFFRRTRRARGEKTRPVLHPARRRAHGRHDRGQGTSCIPLLRGAMFVPWCMVGWLAGGL